MFLDGQRPVDAGTRRKAVEPDESNSIIGVVKGLREQRGHAELAWRQPQAVGGDREQQHEIEWR
jgi:hypothetical protein